MCAFYLVFFLTTSYFPAQITEMPTENTGEQGQWTSALNLE